MGRNATLVIANWKPGIFSESKKVWRWISWAIKILEKATRVPLKILKAPVGPKARSCRISKQFSLSEELDTNDLIISRLIGDTINILIQSPQFISSFETDVFIKLHQFIHTNSENPFPNQYEEDFHDKFRPNLKTIIFIISQKTHTLVIPFQFLCLSYQFL